MKVVIRTACAAALLAEEGGAPAADLHLGELGLHGGVDGRQCSLVASLHLCLRLERRVVAAGHVLHFRAT